MDDPTTQPTRTRTSLRSLRPRGRVRRRSPASRDPHTPMVGAVRGGLDRQRRPPEPQRTTKVPEWRPTRDHLHLLAALVDGGVPLEEALGTLAEMSATDRRRRPVHEAARLVGDGADLATALATVGAPQHVVALVAAGERTGDQAGALRAAGDVVGRLEDVRGTIRRAATYPGVVLGVGVLMVLVISTLIVPPLERTFVELGGELPAPTRLVLAISAALRDGRAVLAAGCLVVAVVLVRRALRPSARARVLDRTPVVRSLRRALDVAVLARLVATMLEGGVRVFDALDVAATLLPAGPRREAVTGAAARLGRGGDALEEQRFVALFTPVERELLAVGERHGVLAAQWRRVAERRDEALKEHVDRLGSVVEPVLVVLVGLIVGGAVLALYLPTFRVLELV